MVWRVTVQPASEPVSLAEARLFCKVVSDYTGDDALISSLIVAARRQIELQTNRAIVAQTWQIDFAGFPDRCIWLPGNVQSITSVKYYSGGILTTYAPTDYITRLTEPARIAPLAGYWPASDDRPDAVQIVAVVGYTTVPEDLKTAIKLMVGTWYENRQGVVGFSAQELPMAVNAILSMYSDRSLI